MKNRRRLASRLLWLALPLLAGSSLILHSATAQIQSAATPAQASDPIAVADQVSRLVQNGKIEELSSLEAKLPGTAQTGKIKVWTSDYLGQMKRQEADRDKQYTEAVATADKELKAQHFDKGIASIVDAFRIAKNPDDFLAQQWVKDAAATVKAKADDLEKQGRWIESLQLFIDLNTLYEVDTRYKADMQRLARRTRLLAVYTPKILFEMRKAIAAQEKKEGADPTQEDPNKDLPPSFTAWQDYVKGVTVSMMRQSIENSHDHWVQERSYQTLVNGGLDTLSLFLTTPELGREFVNLTDAKARETFEKALAGARATAAKPDLGPMEVEAMVRGLIAASDESIKIPREVIIMEFTDGAMETLDPFTAVIWPHEVPEFEKNMAGKFGGVGIQISMENGVLKVISPLEDTPAFKAGIEAGDVITGIDGTSTVGISIDKAVSTIMGLPGTPVTLRVKRGKEEKDYKLERAMIKVSSVKGFRRDPKNPVQWDFMLDPDSKIGYVRVTGFQEDTADELSKALDTLNGQKMRGLVLDFRFNPGGLLSAAVEISDMFLRDGVIVSTRGRSPRAREQKWTADLATKIDRDMPLIVLVNEYSASASEIFAGAMKDLHRATIVGHRTFGKGSVQNLIKISDNILPSGLPEAMMKLTMAGYYLPNNESLHRHDGDKKWGVDPDVVIDLTPTQLADLIKNRRDSEVIKPTNAPAVPEAPATGNGPGVATQKAEPAADIQLETALIMMRLQLLQAISQARG